MSIKYFISDKNDGNLAFHVGDIIENVEKNRENLAKKYSYKNEDMVYMNQIHSDNIVIVDEKSDKLIDNCDAIITNSKNLPLMVMVADCIPILLFDEKKSVISAIHAGRNSTFLEITKKTAQIFIDKFNSNPKDIRAVLGASIQKCCYEVSLEMAKIVESSFGKEFVEGRNIDLQNINRKQLNDLGIKNIEISDICTKCGTSNYFSYRKNSRTGRFAAIITLH
ncbi:peptidoglycan editing factor PgeF [Aliarcobacter thereius]|uniref:Purine nucleoside phosphorylase n=2 Tax=Aliarcobacter thereius TaxID=544718 RepID=A0A1C0B6T3_9BACT|nr:peptidoglycan editing factor PgeF [Aliarcobacter thereius]OCL95969.1 Laccase domain protein YfiH [Aliarcobacter thereius LMG 24486]OCL99298.1 Laccase domain protein YfiH [Aliarcobacter thereius]QBF16059.1 multi-copper polyphenol oxidoreductase laccase [Aliarcobacter thereius LMG 24486]TLS71879.1 peptidoglycan editing factor PgeF [Aliarcobacter thereius]TLS94600.1 peptidoglycan editing factor PgeF [Aliarcobacter thereius]